MSGGLVIASTGPAAAARARWRGGSPRHLGCPIWTPACCIARSAGACWMPAAIRPTRPPPRRRRAHCGRPIWSADDLRGPMADAAAAAVAAIPAVRAALLEFQRGFGAERGAVLDGRDIGTVMFPDAPVKLFVTASLAERARRRWLELRGQGRRRGSGDGRGRDAGARHARRAEHAARGGRGGAGYDGAGRRAGVPAGVGRDSEPARLAGWQRVEQAPYALHRPPSARGWRGCSADTSDLRTPDSLLHFGARRLAPLHSALDSAQMRRISLLHRSIQPGPRSPPRARRVSAIGTRKPTAHPGHPARNHP